jgi:hypothetical protein
MCKHEDLIGMTGCDACLEAKVHGTALATFTLRPYSPCCKLTGGQAVKRVELKLGDKTIEGTLVDFETVREEYNSYKLSDGSTIRMKTVVTNIIRTEEFTPTGEPVYIINSQNVLVADVPDQLKKHEQIQ